MSQGTKVPKSPLRGHRVIILNVIFSKKLKNGLKIGSNVPIRCSNTILSHFKFCHSITLTLSYYCHSKKNGDFGGEHDGGYEYGFTTRC